MKAAITSAFVALLSLVAGHGAVTSYTITTDGKSVDYPGYEGFSPASSPATIQRQWPNYDPIFKVDDPKMVC
jgi:hypothetical protein